MFKSFQFQRISVTQDERTLIVKLQTGHKANALCFETMEELTTLATEVAEDEAICAVILTGSDGIFSSGMNLSDPRITNPTSQTFAERRRNASLGAKMCRAWESIGGMTIAAIEGPCVGGGVALSLALDLRVCANDCILYVPEVERGMNMSWQSVPRSVALIGPSKTKRMFALAEKVSAATALSWGWADYLANPGGAQEQAVEIAKRIEKQPPISTRMCKESVNIATHALNHAVSFMDGDQLMLTQYSEDYVEGIHSYLEKRTPVYKGT